MDVDLGMQGGGVGKVNLTFSSRGIYLLMMGLAKPIYAVFRFLSSSIVN